MGLIGNYSSVHKSPIRSISFAADRTNFSHNSSFRNRLTNFPLSAIPNGYAPGYAFVPAQKDGGIASSTLTYATMTENVSLAAGFGLTGSLSGLGTITGASLGQVVSLSAALSAAISNSADISGILNLLASISASGSFTNTQISAVGFLAASISGSGTLSANNFATAEISADISSVTELSPQSLAQAVWAEIIEAGYSSSDVLRLLSSIAAGKTNIVDNGGGSATVTFRDLADTKDRVDADMVGSERHSVALDLT